MTKPMTRQPIKKLLIITIVSTVNQLSTHKNLMGFLKVNTKNFKIYLAMSCEWPTFAALHSVCHIVKLFHIKIITIKTSLFLFQAIVPI